MGRGKGGRRGSGRGATADAILEAMLARTAHACGAVDLATGERLARIGRADMFTAFGHVSLGDYARELVDVGASRGYELAALARDLWTRPELRAAVHAGAVTPAEAQARIRLEKDSTGEPVTAEERFRRVVLAMPPEHARVLETTLHVSALLMPSGLASSKWQRLEPIFQEFIGRYGAPDVPPEDERWEAPRSPAPVPERERDGIDLDQIMDRGGRDGALLAGLLEELARREDLTRLLPPPDGSKIPVVQLDRELRELAALRASWSELFGRLCALVHERGAWRLAGYVRWEDYCVTRLGMTDRTVRKYLHLEKRMRALPPLREALRSGLGVEKAREISREATQENVEQMIREARSSTVIGTRRRVEQEADRKMSGTGVLEVSLPERVDELRRAAFASAREQAGRYLTPSECMFVIAMHFLETHAEDALVALSRMHPVKLRDGCLCQAPGCSRPAEHVHHIREQSRGGGDAQENLIALCAGHHLQVVHRGFLVVAGEAPDAIVWRIGPELERLRREAGLTAA